MKLAAALSLALGALLLIGVRAAPAGRAQPLPLKALMVCGRAIYGQIGPKTVMLYGHEFTCKRADVSSRRDGSHRVTGELSHNLRFWKDDQIAYRFEIDRCTRLPNPRSWQVSVNGADDSADPEAVARLFGRGDVEDAWRKAGRSWDSDWQDTAHFALMWIGANFADLSEAGSAKLQDGC